MVYDVDVMLLSMALFRKERKDEQWLKRVAVKASLYEQKRESWSVRKRKKNNQIVVNR